MGGISSSIQSIILRCNVVHINFICLLMLLQGIKSGCGVVPTLIMDMSSLKLVSCKLILW